MEDHPLGEVPHGYQGYAAYGQTSPSHPVEGLGGRPEKILRNRSHRTHIYIVNYHTSNKMFITVFNFFFILLKLVKISYDLYDLVIYIL